MTGSNKGASVRTTSVSQWKKSTQGTPLVVPSGNTCMVRPLGMDVLVKSGMIPNSLMGFITQALSKGKAPSQQDDFSIANLGGEQLEEILNLFDAVCVQVVLDPPVYPTPEEGMARHEDRLYVDEVEFGDKVFIFQFAVGGTRDLEKFRQESESYLASVQDVSVDVLPPQSTAGD